MDARPLLALLAALGACLAAPAAPDTAPTAAPDTAASAAAAPAAWRAPPPHEAHFVTAGRGYGYDYQDGGRALPPPPPSLRPRAAPRRLVYYADLPDVPATPYPRHGRLEGGGYGRDLQWQRGRDREWQLRQRERDRPLSYSIVDADAQPDLQGRYTEADRRREFPPLPVEARYNRLPAPQQPYYSRRWPQPQPQPDRDPALYPYSYSYPGGRPEPDYTAARRPRPELQYTATVTARPEEDPRRPPTAYRGPQGSAPLLPSDGGEPYRGYNPRQPAPWSMQIGARLTVKDDGRRLPFGVGGGGGGGGGGGPGRRFYVNSQAPGPHYAVPLRYS